MPHPNGDPTIQDLYNEVAQLDRSAFNMQPDSALAIAASIQAKAAIIQAEALLQIANALTVDRGI